MGVWKHQGCYTEATSGRALSSKQIYGSASNGDMDLEMCASFCFDNGYSLFGVEYGQQCYCGNLWRRQATEPLLPRARERARSRHALLDKVSRALEGGKRERRCLELHGLLHGSDLRPGPGFGAAVRVVVDVRDDA